VSDLAYHSPAHCSPKSSITLLLGMICPIKRTYEAAAYTDAPKKLLDWKCTMDDVADFVTDYINSDVSALLHVIVPSPDCPIGFGPCRDQLADHRGSK
jgi:hypothetical protein